MAEQRMQKSYRSTAVTKFLLLSVPVAAHCGYAFILMNPCARKDSKYVLNAVNLVRDT